MRNLQITALAALGVAFMTAPADAAGRSSRCESAVNDEIARLQVDPGTISSISIETQSHESRSGSTRIDRILAWVDLQTCHGKLVIDMSPQCRVKQAYTRGECRVPGLPSC